MPLNTGIAGGVMSIGRDVAVDITLSSGRTLSLGNITSFDRKPKVKKLQSLGIDGIPRNAVIPEGWDLSFDVDRQDSQGDLYWAEFEADYFAGRVLRGCTITETISEADGTISQYRYEGVALHPTDIGAFKADAYVKMKWAGEASFRKRVI